MSGSRILPLKRAATGPILTAMPIAYWFSPVASTLSQPGMHTFSTSGSLRASQACCCVTARWRLPCMSMVSSLALFVQQVGQAARQVLQLFEVVHGQHRMGVPVQHRRTARQRSIAFEAQQRVEPQQAAAAMRQPIEFAREVLRLPGVEAIRNDEDEA